MDNRFNYVWEHFKSVYQVPPEVAVHYGDKPAGRVFIQKHSGDFFQKQSSQPENVIWQEWREQNIPFPFYRDERLPLLSFYYKQVYIHYDIIAATFYFLSGWQEYYSSDRDKFGRFPYRSSIQYRLGIITLPVVNYYFDILKTALEKAYLIELKPAFNTKGAFTSFITHDIDNAESAWKAEGFTALKKGNIAIAVNRLLKKISGKDAWFNWPVVANLVQEYGAVSTFFFLCENKPHNGYNNADFRVQDKKYQQKIILLKARGCEINLHGSFETALSQEKFYEESARLGWPVNGNRFHYLSFDPRQTPALLDELKINYDSTLGFAEHFGFRHSYCFPLRLFNFRENKPYQFLEIPLNLMDATLHHPNYLKLSASEVIPAIKPMLTEIKKFGGCFTLLWHNENFSSFNKNNGLAVFKNIMQFLQAQNSNFATGNNLYQHFRQYFIPAIND